MNPIIPSHDPADSNTMPGVLGIAFSKELQDTDVQLPAVVVYYDRVKNLATVLPLVSRITTDGTARLRAQLAKVPVLALGGGGFCVTFPLVAGDLGWIEASDRDISLFMQAMKQAKPNTMRIHSFEDARFIPDAFHKYTLSGEDSENMVIQSYDGTVKVALGPSLINVDAPTVNINATTAINMTSPALSIKTNALTMTDMIGGISGTMGIDIPVVMTNTLTLEEIVVNTHRHPDSAGYTGEMTT